MALWADFKKFAFKGNIIDLAIGVIIGGAFGKIVTALVNDLIMPLVALIMPSGDWRAAKLVLRAGPTPKEDVAVLWGDFIGTILDFAIIATALFILVSRLLKAIHLHKEEVKDVKECPFCLDTIPGKAKKCKSCTADQPDAAAAAAGSGAGVGAVAAGAAAGAAAASTKA